MTSRRALMALVSAVSVAALLPAGAGAEEPAAAPIQALNVALLIIMHMGRARAFADRARVLTPVVQATFDLPLILENSVGPAKWARLQAGQQTELLDVFTQFTVASYVANFDAFNGEAFVIAPELRHVGKDVVVLTRIVPQSGDPTRLDYVMRERGGLWRVVDILLEGSISRVAVTRSDFRALLKDNDAGPLIHSLSDKVAAFTASNAP